MSDNPNPHQGHRNRVRERILSEGIANFQPHEVLEFLLFHSVPQKDTNAMAHELIKAFGSFDSVLDASVDELVELAHVSKNTAVFISSVKEIFSYYEKSKSKNNSYDNLDKMISLLKSYFIGTSREKTIFVFFDTGFRIKSVEAFDEGQETGLNFSVKDIIKKALTHNAYYIVMSHNHPTSNSAPSPSDIQATIDIRDQFEHLGLRLIDHIIFGFNTDPLSFAALDEFSDFVSPLE